MQRHQFLIFSIAFVGLFTAHFLLGIRSPLSPWTFFTGTAQIPHHIALPSASVAPGKRAQARVVVVTVWTHYPEMMAMQVASLRHFLRHDLEYLAVANSNSDATNQAIKDAAINLSVSCHHHISSPGCPSCDHAAALNDALRYLLRGGAYANASHGGDDLVDSAAHADKGAILLRPSDMLFLLDSDMYLVSPLDFHTELEGGNHLLTSVQRRNGASRCVSYMWPNFSLFYFGDLGPSRALELFAELDFGGGCRTDGAVMDSGACTAPFLDTYGEELGIVEVVNSCSVSYEGLDRLTCNFLARENGLPRATQCTTSYMLESEALAANPLCEHVDIPGVEGAWQPTVSQKGSMGANDSTSDNRAQLSCPKRGKIYHLGSAGSNWRGCPEDFLRGQRERFFTFFGQLISG